MLKKACGFLLVMVFLGSGFVMAGSLAEKAEIFDESVARNHIPLGLVVNLQPVSDGRTVFSSSADSTIWTGTYIASQIYRYKVTGNHAALENVMKCLEAFVTLQEMSGNQGFMGRCFGFPEQFQGQRGFVQGVGSYSHLVYRADTSRDQYTGVFLGTAAAWPYISNVELRNRVARTMENAGLNLVKNNLALHAKIGDETIIPFNLNPDYAYQDRINPEEWAKVDDFPANVFAQMFPYTDRLARVVASFRPPPVRGGEALRALLMLETAARISENPEIESFLNNYLLKEKAFHEIASSSCLLLADVFYGRRHDFVRAKMSEIFAELVRLCWHGLAIRLNLPESLANSFEAMINPFKLSMGRMMAGRTLAILNFAREGGGFLLLERLSEIAARSNQFLKSLLPSGGKINQKLESLSDQFRRCSQSNIDEFADTMRSYVGCNLTFLALLGVLEHSQNELCKKSALAILPRAFSEIADEKNSLYTFITAAFCPEAVNENQMKGAMETMRLYPLDQIERRFEHRPERVSPWPDRFGRYGRQGIDLIPIDQRAPHIFIWQEPPRSLVTGSDSGRKIAPAGYLLAYWFARYHKLIGAED
ncbi:MAG: hypothetical protein ACOYXC_06275 [Candidatus Rifleibacteriota bacterium]